MKPQFNKLYLSTFTGTNFCVYHFQNKHDYICRWIPFHLHPRWFGSNYRYDTIDWDKNSTIAEIKPIRINVEI